MGIKQEIEQTISIKPAAAQSRVDTPSRATGQSVSAAAGFGQPPALSSRPRLRSASGKRSVPPHTSEPPAKKQRKWSPEEDALLNELQTSGMEWPNISEYLQDKGFIRSSESCRVRNYLQRTRKKLSCWNHGCNGKQFANLHIHQKSMKKLMENGGTQQGRACTSCHKRKKKCNRARPCSCCSIATRPRECIYQTEAEATTPKHTLEQPTYGESICPEVCTVRPRWSQCVKQAVGG